MKGHIRIPGDTKSATRHALPAVAGLRLPTKADLVSRSVFQASCTSRFQGPTVHIISAIDDREGSFSDLRVYRR